MKVRRTYQNREQRRVTAQERSFKDSLENSRRAIDHTTQEVRRFRRRANADAGLSENHVREAIRSIQKAASHLEAVEQTAEADFKLRKELRDASTLLNAIAYSCEDLELEARRSEVDLSFATTELRKASQLLQRAGSLQLVLDEPQERPDRTVDTKASRVRRGLGTGLLAVRSRGN